MVSRILIKASFLQEQMEYGPLRLEARYLFCNRIGNEWSAEGMPKWELDISKELQKWRFLIIRVPI